jgi:hypothetical protein
MRNTNTKTGSKRAGLAAGLIAAAAMLGGIALGEAAVANAERELDLVGFENCVEMRLKYAPHWGYNMIVSDCCAIHGGDEYAEAGVTKCAAPPCNCTDPKTEPGTGDPQPQDPRTGTYEPPQGPVVTAP